MGNVAGPSSTAPQPTNRHERVRAVAGGRRSRRGGEQSPAHPPSEQRRDLPVGGEATMRDARDRKRRVSRATPPGRGKG